MRYSSTTESISSALSVCLLGPVAGGQFPRNCNSKATSAARSSSVSGISISCQGESAGLVRASEAEAKIQAKFGLPPEVQTAVEGAFAARIPLQRFGNADEVAHLSLFLASDQASYITGAEIPVDGGFCAA